MQVLLRTVMGLAGFLVGVGLTACARQDMRSVELRVPDMDDPRAVRIVTNAALNEVVGSYDGVHCAYEVDVSRSLVLYHETARLTDPVFRREITRRLEEVGFQAQIRSVRLNPPPLTPTRQGLVQIWPERYTAEIAVAGLKSFTDANVAIDAIALARTGDRSAVVADATARVLQVAYDGRQLARQNLATAIACAGFAVDDTPARLGHADALPLKWMPVSL